MLDRVMFTFCFMKFIYGWKMHTDKNIKHHMISDYVMLAYENEMVFWP
jgi:hypothetical protein